MSSTPFETLGLLDSATLEEAEVAFRRLAQRLHPDKADGDEAKFKAVNEAWRLIKNGWRPKPTSTFKSSFSDPKKPTPEPPPKKSRTVKLPVSTRSKPNSLEFDVVLEISDVQGFHGCTVPFIHNGKVLDFTVPAGTVKTYTARERIPLNPMIGATTGSVMFNITVKIFNEEVLHQRADKEVTVRVNPIGLMIGGSIKVKNGIGVDVELTIAPGSQPHQKIILPKMGYGGDDKGDLIVTLLPVFKSPAEFTSNDWFLVDQLTALKNV